jgi:hypothetical protein
MLKPPLSIERGAALLYQITIDNQLNITVNPKQPMRGFSAFQTDLCIFERKSDEIIIPRVVFEFKTRITTHDVITYSAKARKHKQIYPYLRYGIIASDISIVPSRLFTHNESLDFCAAVSNIKSNKLKLFISKLIESEINTSWLLEAIAFGSVNTRLFRTEIIIE